MNIPSAAITIIQIHSVLKIIMQTAYKHIIPLIPLYIGTACCLPFHVTKMVDQNNSWSDSSGQCTSQCPAVCRCTFLQHQRFVLLLG